MSAVKIRRSEKAEGRNGDQDADDSKNGNHAKNGETSKNGDYGTSGDQVSISSVYASCIFSNFQIKR
jgi:hypothetical protein